MSRKTDVADRVEGWIGLSAKWTAYTGSDRVLTGAIGSTGDTFSDRPMCCWEMPMLAAVQLGYLAGGALDAVYDGIDAGGLKKCAPLLKSGLIWTSTSSYPGKRPERGDLVFFADANQGELAHVALALGEQASGQAVIMSFWTAAPRLKAMEWFEQYGGRAPTAEGGEAYKRLVRDYSAVDARVVKTTVEGLQEAMAAICQAKPSVSSAAPVWS